MKHAIVALLPLKEAVGTCRASLVPYPCLIDSGIRRMRQRLLDGLHAVHRPARPPHSWHPLEAIVASCTVDSYLHGAKRWQETLCLPSSLLGSRAEIETLNGRVAVRIPAWSSSDKILRLKGKGLPNKTGDAADLFVHIQIMLPEDGDEQLESLLRSRAG
jgi:hypothetical protein